MGRWKWAALAVAAMIAGTPAWADQATAIMAVKRLPRAIDAEVDKGGNMYVLVKPEKVEWSQYAGAVCSVVKPHRARIFSVRVVEVPKANRTKPATTWERAGEASCAQ